MRSTDLIKGEHYATERGERYEVFDNNMGWALEGGFWVERKPTGRKRNSNIRVYRIFPNGIKRRAVIEPRFLKYRWEEWAALAAIRRESKAQEVSQHTKREREFVRRLTRLGITNVRVNRGTETVTMPMEDIEKLLDGALAS